MTDVTTLSVHRASLITQAFWAVYRDHEQRLQLLGLIGPCLAKTDDEDHVLVDFAACLTIAISLPRLMVSGSSLQQLKVADGSAYRLLNRATTAYFSSRELRGELGLVAIESFEQLQAALSDAA